MFHKSNNKNNNDVFLFFLLSIQCLRKHIGHAGSPHVALQMTFRAFSWETLTVQLFSLWTNCQTNSLFLQAKKTREENIDLKDLE